MNKPPTPKRLAPGPVAVVPVAKFPDPVFEGEVAPTVIHPDFRGLNLVTGFRGSGKTSYGLKMDRPGNILMLDYEDKGELLAKPLGVGGYFQVMTEIVTELGSKFELQAVYDRTLQILEAVPKGRFTTLFIDNAQDLQDGCAQVLRNNPDEAVRYGVRPENAISGAYGGAIPAVKHLVKNILHLVNGKQIQVVVVSFQLKGAWADKRPLFNQFKMTDVSVWHERSILTLVMVDPLPWNFPIPRALVMKEQLSRMEWDEEEKRTKQVRRLPMALPMAEPRFIYQYLDKGADFKFSAPGEGVTAEELAPFKPTFSKEQLFILERMVRAQKELGLSSEEEQ